MRKKCLLGFLLCTCVSVFSQNEFAAIQQEVNEWYASFGSASTINKKTPKSIDFDTQHYSISGIIAKGILCDGTTASFYETTSLIPNLLLEGRVSYQTSRLVVEGIRYIKTRNGTNKIYGTFYVYNMDDYTMNYKPKKAGALRIKCSQASYLEGSYLDCPVIVNLKKHSSVYVDGKTGGRGYSFLSAVIPNITLSNDDSFDVYQILLQAKDEVTMCWENGTMFKGRVKPTPREDGVIIFYTLEGQQTGMVTGPKRITVSRENGNLVYTQEDNDDNQLLSKETVYVKDDGTLSEMDYWNISKIFEKCYHAKWTYRNGNYFEGTIKPVITRNENTNTLNISSTATKGVFKYSNGDRFEGDLSSKSVGPFFIDGTTYFVDGTTSKGNWLEKYRLSDRLWKKVYECENPSEAKELAKELMIEYEEQIKQEHYQSLVNSVKALGETPYQKALISWNNKLLKKLETECGVSRKTIRDGEFIGGLLTGSYINQATLVVRLGPALFEASTNSFFNSSIYKPTVLKSIVLESEQELDKIKKLAVPIEIELEKLQLEQINKKNSQ